MKDIEWNSDFSLPSGRQGRANVLHSYVFAL